MLILCIWEYECVGVDVIDVIEWEKNGKSFYIMRFVFRKLFRLNSIFSNGTPYMQWKRTKYNKYLLYREDAEDTASFNLNFE